MATLTNPKYTVIAVTKRESSAATTTAKYDLTGAVTALSLEENENGIAQKVSITMNQIYHDGAYLTSILAVHDSIYVYANTGSGNVEVFRGYIWTTKYSKDKENEITITCYDMLIYLQESEEYKYFSSGKSTASIFSTICKSKGIPLKYSYSSIKHSKLVIRGTLADAFETELIENVRKKTGKRGVIRAASGTMYVFESGEINSTIYQFYRGDGGNILSTTHEVTMDGITTKVIIIGSEKKNKAAPIKATVSGNTSKYGTIQKIISSSDSDKLSTLKQEANQTIKDDGNPKKSVTVQALDIPWVRKGDKIHLNDGYVNGYAVVKSVNHDAVKKVIDMEVRML